jgi:hypothetical protein
MTDLYSMSVERRQGQKVYALICGTSGVLTVTTPSRFPRIVRDFHFYQIAIEGQRIYAQRRGVVFFSDRVG